VASRAAALRINAQRCVKLSSPARKVEPSFDHVNPRRKYGAASVAGDSLRPKLHRSAAAFVNCATRVCAERIAACLQRNLGDSRMKKLLLGSSVLIGAGALASTAQASDGIKLEVGGFFNTVYMGVFDKKSDDRFGNHRNIDALQHNAEVYFKGETKLDNGLTIGARIELEGENAADQIDKSFVY
jgi:hypothetical protein